MAAYNLVGQVFNQLLVLERKGSDRNRQALWLCVCTCGNTKILNSNVLVKSRVKSCGCLQKEAMRKLATHKMTGTAIYKRWASMKARCNYSGTVNFENYGGRGITYSPDWEDFACFYNDMSEGFHESLELDRIDVNAGYSKENCRWVTHNENNYNKRIQSNNSTGKTGVSFKNNIGKWFAYITVNRKQINLGFYELFDDAVQARKEAELKYYGYKRP